MNADQEVFQNQENKYVQKTFPPSSSRNPKVEIPMKQLHEVKQTQKTVLE